MQYAKDIMTSKVVTLQKDLDVSQVIAIFLENSISGAPVVDKEENVVGLVSIFDILKSSQVRAVDISIISEGDQVKSSALELFNRLLDVETKEKKVVDIMKPIVVHATEKTSIKELASMMHNAKIHRILILDDKKIVGIVSSMDMLKCIYHD